MESPSMVTPLGAKGIGEGNCMSTPVCLANAVADAIGAKDITLPMSPARIAAMIQGEEKAAPPEKAAAAEAAAKDKPGHKLHGTGETLVPAPREEVWRTLLDPKALASVIPGCHSLDRVSDNSYKAEVSLGVGPVRGKFHANVALSEMTEPEAATLKGGVIGPLGASQGTGHVRLAAEGDGTKVSYDYEIELSGKVASIGGRMLEGAAKALVNQFFERLVAQVGGEADKSGGKSKGLLGGLFGKQEK